jgi:hypothetical protein
MSDYEKRIPTFHITDDLRRVRDFASGQMHIETPRSKAWIIWYSVFLAVAGALALYKITQ